MKNICVVMAIAVGAIGFFSFTDSNAQNNSVSGLQSADTVPHKKDSGRKKGGTVPYDSFGKPKNMDSTARF